MMNTLMNTLRMDANEDASMTETSAGASSSYDMQRSEILQERARKFIAERKKERSGEASVCTVEITASETHDQPLGTGTFGAVSRYQTHQTRVTCLNTGESSEAVELGTLRNVGDSRYRLNTEIVNYKNKKVISMSCSRVTLACLLSCCGGSRWGGGAVVIALTDQNFLANIHASEGKDCVRIIRVEGASLGELSGELVAIAPVLPAGSVIVLVSAAHLAAVGTQSYAADFVTVCRRLCGQYRGEVEVCHGPFLFMEGFRDEGLARGILEIYAWLKGLKEERTILANTIEFTRMELLNNGMVREGGSAAPCRIRLPMSTKSYEAKTFESSGWANLYVPTRYPSQPKQRSSRAFTAS
jgi:metal-responsive CopG/Arc/MetJ family transcriptional regulator